MRKKRGYTKARIKEARKGKKQRRKKHGLGFSPAKETASGAGTHGGGRKSQHKRERKKAKIDLRNWQE
jgi:hypothetical protein